MPREFQNNPNLTTNGSDQSIKRFVHQPLTVNHGGFKFKIHPNGKTTISGPSRKLDKPDEHGNDYEFDEITIPASLVFKIQQALFMTRETKYLNMREVEANPEGSAPVEDFGKSQRS